MRPIAQHHYSVESQARFNEFIDGVTITSLGVLHHIFSFAVVLQDRSRNAIKPRVVASHHNFVQRRATANMRMPTDCRQTGSDRLFPVCVIRAQPTEKTNGVPSSAQQTSRF
jgi:hypothetical protein